MASATRMACSKESDGNSGKSDGNEGGGLATAMRAMARARATTWAMATASRQVDDKEGNGDSDEGGRGAAAMATKMAMTIVTRVAGKQWQRQQRG
jgi:hypothetical protein